MPAITELVIKQSPTQQATALPDEVLMAAESQWLFTEEELSRAPSIMDGLSPEKERENRGKGVNFILQVGIMLKLPQITLATASVFLHRFYMRHSMQDVPGRPGHHYYSMAATSLFLATKVEENCRKMKELVIACVRVAQKDPYKTVDEQDKEYWRWRDNILLNEDLMLEAICFDLRLEAPYKILYDLLLTFREEKNKKLRNAAWAFISDSCLTPLCLLFSGRTIASSALYAAAKHSGVAFPDDESGRPWWEVIGVDLKDIGKSCNYMAEVYQGAPAKAGRENGLYEKIPRGSGGMNDKTRLVESYKASDLSTNGELQRCRKLDWEGDPRAENTSHIMGRINGFSNESVQIRSGGDVVIRTRKRRRLSIGEPEIASLGISDHHHLDIKALQGAANPAQPPQQSSFGSQPDSVIAVLKESADGGSLINPKPGDASEEGEVDA